MGYDYLPVSVSEPMKTGHALISRVENASGKQNTEENN